MATQWVDFKAVKSAVNMSMVLDRYGVNWLRKNGDELRGRCPIHQGQGEDAFHVNVAKGAFQCFSCKARGNVLDFVAAMEKSSVRDAALTLAEWFAITLAPSDNKQPDTQTSKRSDAGERGADQVNEPLTFELRAVDPDHSYLRDRGISPETAQTFGVGYFSGRGSMHGRVVIPIHNHAGQLVAYAGRAIDGTEPKYRLPAGFHKSLELFNLHRAIGDSKPRRRVVIVEGFFDCMKVHQAGFPALALMGCFMSQAQEDLLTRHFKAAAVMLDGDEAGQQAADEILLRLGRRMWTRAVLLPQGKQPDTLEKGDLTELLEK